MAGHGAEAVLKLDKESRPLRATTTQRAWRRFKSNKRGYFSLWIFTILFILSLFAEVLSNDKPLIVHYNDSYYFPLFVTYPETEFGGDFVTETDYLDPFIREQLKEGNNWAIYPLNPYSYDTINYFAELPNPADEAPPGETRSLFYVIVAEDNDDLTGPCDHRARL